jgi:amino-acid N-acetyltransferase
MQITFRAATEADRPAVEALLQACQLPTADLPTGLPHFLLAFNNTKQLAGVAGLEIYGPDALLRSVAVAPEFRRRYVGRNLFAELLDQAVALRVKRMYLLTTSAERYFARLGFATVERELVPASVQASAQFAGGCPSSATAMHLDV